MIKNYKRFLSFILVFCIMVTSFGSFSFAEQIGEDDRFRITEEGVYIDYIYYTQEEFGDLLNNAEVIEITSGSDDEITLRSGFAIAAGTYIIAGIGEVIVTELGKIIVAGSVVAAGTWLYDKIMDWFTVMEFNKSAKEAVNSCNDNLKHHIMQKHHNWNNFNKDPKWSDIAPLLIKALKDGTESYNNSNGTYTRTLTIKGYSVSVRFIKSVDGLVRYISTAWSN